MNYLWENCQIDISFSWLSNVYGKVQQPFLFISFIWETRTFYFPIFLSISINSLGCFDSLKSKKDLLTGLSWKDPIDYRHGRRVEENLIFKPPSPTNSKILSALWRGNNYLYGLKFSLKNMDCKGFYKQVSPLARLVSARPIALFGMVQKSYGKDEFIQMSIQ